MLTLLTLVDLRLPGVQTEEVSALASSEGQLVCHTNWWGVAVVLERVPLRAKSRYTDASTKSGRRWPVLRCTGEVCFPDCSGHNSWHPRPRCSGSREEQTEGGPRGSVFG